MEKQHKPKQQNKIWEAQASFGIEVSRTALSAHMNRVKPDTHAQTLANVHRTNDSRVESYKNMQRMKCKHMHMHYLSQQHAVQLQQPL